MTLLPYPLLSPLCQVGLLLSFHPSGPPLNLSAHLFTTLYFSTNQAFFPSPHCLTSRPRLVQELPCSDQEQCLKPPGETLLYVASDFLQILMALH